MATRLFLRDLTASNPPSAGDKSTALPEAGATLDGNSGSGFEDLSLKTTKGGAQTTKTRASLAQTAHQDNYIARFTSDALTAQTISANTWTLGLAASEANANANSFFHQSIYVWRPGTQAVVGFIYDSADGGLGVEWTTTEDGQVFTVSGSAVTAQDNDVLVFEMWRHAAQAMAASYTQTLYFEGTTDVVDATTTDAASYIETPQALTFLVTDDLATKFIPADDFADGVMMITGG